MSGLVKAIERYALDVIINGGEDVERELNLIAVALVAVHKAEGKLS